MAKKEDRLAAARKKGGGCLKKKRKKGWRTALAGMACMAVLLGLTGEQFRAGAAWSPGQQGGAVSRRVVPLGRAVGIKLFSDGVLVVGLSAIETDQGSKSPGKDCGLKLGDVITHVDGDQVDTIQQMQDQVERHKGQPLTIQAMRGEKQVQLTAAPVANRQGTYQLGVWLRDSMAGIGTMTFWDPDTGVFAALGHGINDVDTASLMPLESGGIMAATVSGVERGRAGAPGELHGDFDLTADLGSLYANTSQGVFGRTAQRLSGGTGAVEVARCDQVHTGPATILSNIRGELAQGKDVTDLLQAAFPGGSITGAPKYRAMEIIDELEHGKRGLYTGSIGYLTLDGDCDLNIVIRTALHRDGRYHLGVGGGITAESDLEFEYEETLQKAKAVLEALQ